MPPKDLALASDAEILSTMFASVGEIRGTARRSLEVIEQSWILLRELDTYEVDGARIRLSGATAPAAIAPPANWFMIRNWLNKFQTDVRNLSPPGSDPDIIGERDEQIIRVGRS
jgi:hypothetical protein